MTGRSRRREAPMADCAPRARRVMLLLAAVVVLSLGDLLFTLLYLSTTGMIEANPIAAYLIRTTHSWEALAVFKLATVGLCVALLYRVRRYPEGEFAAWGAATIMVMLTIHWNHYTDHHEDGGAAMSLAENALPGDVWLTLD